ncbi:hypothetical protein [Pseudobutyrivibrio sp. LB2011]|uniref:hypothetical protein n=1 Tax=Pseudobutyrivibrio sp. LB2011 TaxID=1408312 RepID=UPI0005D1FE1E|nr:hypothetical protein [Pseudobutyrivibrio sp. LB2011]
MCLIKPDSEKVPLVNYEFLMFVDGTTTSVRDALEDFVQTRLSSYLHNPEIRSLFAEYEKYLYVSYYIDGYTSHVNELKKKLIDLINPQIKISKRMEKGSTENGFEE